MKRLLFLYTPLLLLFFFSTAAVAQKEGFFGIDHPFEFLPASSYDSDLREMKNVGVESVRMSLPWKRMEATRGRYNFETTDKVIEVASRHGIKVFGTFVNLPDWASKSKNTLDVRHLEQFGEFVKQCVQRYKKTIREWEIWNEPNNEPFWGGTPYEYVELLRIAYNVIKKEDPTAIVIGLSSGSLGIVARPDRWNFIEEVLRDGGGNYFDAVSVHPYRDMYGPDIRNSPGKYPAKWTQLEEISALTALLSRHGVKKDVYITEMGWPDANGQDLQAAYLTRSYVALYSLPNVKRLSWFFWREGTYNVKNYGLVGIDLMPKIAYHAYRNTKTLLSGATFKTRTVTDHLAVYAFEKSGHEFWVLWSPDNKTRRVSIASIVGKRKMKAKELYEPSRAGASSVESFVITKDPLIVIAE